MSYVERDSGGRGRRGSWSTRRTVSLVARQLVLFLSGKFPLQEAVGQTLAFTQRFFSASQQTEIHSLLEKCRGREKPRAGVWVPLSAPARLARALHGLALIADGLVI